MDDIICQIHAMNEMQIKNTPVRPDEKRSNFWMLIGVCMMGVTLTSLWMIFTPDGYMNKIDAIGYAVCHRIPSHSFMIGDRPLPLCARCSGMYLGALLGVSLQFIVGYKRGGFSRKALMGLALMALFFIIDGFNSFMGLILEQAPLYTPDNSLRLISGIGVGVLIATVVYPIFTQTIWQNWAPKSALDRRWAIPALFVGCALLVIGMLSGLPTILYFLAILSVVGVMVILTLIYAVVLLMLFKQENRYNGFIEMMPSLLGGMVLMMVQIGVLDLARFLLTGTWNGLPL
ncbi:MAG: DUF2085 domain-containing protein [Anaerolineaceae bacterium]|nr:DUF2085 domain-containing protein [Anaerolineaceae bacterium]